MFESFFETLKTVLQRCFCILDPDFVDDQIEELAPDLTRLLKQEFHLHFVLLKNHQNELETNVLLPNEATANELARMTNTRVGMLICRRQQS